MAAWISEHYKAHLTGLAILNADGIAGSRRFTNHARVGVILTPSAVVFLAVHLTSGECQVLQVIQA
jgi:hypothetical protein